MFTTLPHSHCHFFLSIVGNAVPFANWLIWSKASFSSPCFQRHKIDFALLKSTEVTVSLIPPEIATFYSFFIQSDCLYLFKTFCAVNWESELFFTFENVQRLRLREQTLLLYNRHRHQNCSVYASVLVIACVCTRTCKLMWACFGMLKTNLGADSQSHSGLGPLMCFDQQISRWYLYHAFIYLRTCMRMDTQKLALKTVKNQVTRAKVLHLATVLPLWISRASSLTLIMLKHVLDMMILFLFCCRCRCRCCYYPAEVQFCCCAGAGIAFILFSIFLFFHSGVSHSTFLMIDHDSFGLVKPQAQWNFCSSVALRVKQINRLTISVDP